MRIKAWPHPFRVGAELLECEDCGWRGEADDPMDGTSSGRVVDRPICRCVPAVLKTALEGK